ncbi:MAG: hypothetical protein KatS3mg110_3871 [Pirellulaceae bacterium]|nr:MAG: hypothetical protein KatS3mg110_3863 [Pirellulaceae bacterium]GIW95830.1 MAG: hypothetical protein KatS3mg110_3871 [Pirellulaceae bacterium]
MTHVTTRRSFFDGSRRGPWLCLIVAAGTLCATVPTMGQELQREAFHLEGKLQRLAPGLLQVADEQGNVWLVKIEANPRDVSFSATAAPEWLGPGMWVRFSAVLDQRLQAQEPVKELTVFTPLDPSQLGIIPQVSLGKEIFAPPEPQSDQTNKPQLCLVAGRLVGMARGKTTRVSVLAGTNTLTVNLAEPAKIIVEVSDLSWAKPGDKVVLDGWYYPMIPGRAIANRISVSASAELAPARTRPARRPRASESPRVPQQPESSDPNAAPPPG